MAKHSFIYYGLFCNLIKLSIKSGKKYNPEPKGHFFNSIFYPNSKNPKRFSLLDVEWNRKNWNKRTLAFYAINYSNNSFNNLWAIPFSVWWLLHNLFSITRLFFHTLKEFKVFFYSRAFSSHMRQSDILTWLALFRCCNRIRCNRVAELKSFSSHYFPFKNGTVRKHQSVLLELQHKVFNPYSHASPLMNEIVVVI